MLNETNKIQRRLIVRLITSSPAWPLRQVENMAAFGPQAHLATGGTIHRDASRGTTALSEAPLALLIFTGRRRPRDPDAFAPVQDLFCR